MTEQDREWVVDSIRVAILESRKEMLDTDIPQALALHTTGCPWAKKLLVLIALLVGAQVVATASVKFF